MSDPQKPSTAGDVAEDAVTSAPTPAAAPPKASKKAAKEGAPAQPFRLLVNPSGQIVEFNPDDPNFAHYAHLTRPPGVPPEKWYREPTAEEAEAFLAGHGKRK